MRMRTFKNQFAPMVKDGSKRNTIRATPKRMPKAGDWESWRQWSGTPYYSKTIKLAEVELLKVDPITITKDGTMVGERVLSDEQEADRARADGFKTLLHFRAFFVLNGLPFHGILITAK